MYPRLSTTAKIQHTRSRMLRNGVHRPCWSISETVLSRIITSPQADLNPLTPHRNSERDSREGLWPWRNNGLGCSTSAIVHDANGKGNSHKRRPKNIAFKFCFSDFVHSLVCVFNFMSIVTKAKKVKGVPIISFFIVFLFSVIFHRTNKIFSFGGSNNS